jgi:phenylacetate-CoA ligase
VLHVHVASRASFWRKSLFIWAAALARRRIVFHSHSGGFITFMEQLSSVPYFVAMTTINRCDQILCLTTSMQKWFEKLAPRVPVQWWPNPIPADLFDQSSPTGEREPIVLHLGALVTAKGVMDLLDAFTALHGHDPKALLVVGGTGPEMQPMKDIVRSRGLADSVVFLGWIGPEEKKSWLRRARVMALASHVEAQPMVLLEAMASGVAVVSTDVGGIPDVIESGVEGILVPPHQPQLFAEALIRSWDDVPLRSEMVQAAFKSVSKLHKADEVCLALNNLYKRMIRRKRRTFSQTGIALRYRMIDWIRGSDSIGLLDRLRVWQYQTPEQLDQNSRAELARYFADLRNSLPLFRQALQFSDLQIIDKRFIQEHRSELMNPFYSGKVIRKKTGGSTGEPLVYFTGTNSHSYLWAGIFLSWEVAGYRFGDKVAIMAGSSLFATGSKQSVYYRLMNVTVISTFNLSEATMLEVGLRLNREGFKLLYGFSSAIHRIARFHLERRQTISNQLRGIVCTAEVLTEAMRKDIEAAFGVRCYGQYGCHDAGVSAFECERQDGYHLISTRCYAEVLPDGQLISTDLMNRTMFMPRYNTGDMVRMSGRVCACGRGLPLIDEVIGRQNDIVTDSHGNAVHSEFFTHMFREDERVYSFQVLFSDNSLHVNLHVKPNCETEYPEFEAKIRAKVATSLDFSDVRVNFNQPFKAIANGKHRFVLKDDLDNL